MVMWTRLVCAVLVIGSAVAIPKPEEVLTHNRVVDELSHAKHFQDETHNKQYDHDAFLGEEEAKTFDELSPEESQRRLRWENKKKVISQNTTLKQASSKQLNAIYSHAFAFNPSIYNYL